MTLLTQQGITIREQAETIGRLKAELEAVSAEAVRAKARESQLAEDLERSLAELQSQLSEAQSVHGPASATMPWRHHWRQGAFVIAVAALMVLVVVLLLFVLPPLDALL
jgi:hypothetical protein